MRGEGFCFNRGSQVFGKCSRDAVLLLPGQEIFDSASNFYVLVSILAAAPKQGDVLLQKARLSEAALIDLISA